MKRQIIAAIIGVFIFTSSIVSLGNARVDNCRPAWKCTRPSPTIRVTPSPIPTIKPTPAPTTSTYTFEDKFDGVQLTTKWVPLYGPGDPGDRLDTDCGNFGLNQVSVSNGIATLITERKSTPSGRAFAGGCIATFGTFSQKYGTWETRIRYDEAKGTWPSWFLLPVGQKNPYPEIDVFEAYGDSACLGPGAVVHAIHYAGETVSDYQITPLANSSDWHVWKIVWTSTKVEFWVDGILKFTNTTHVPQVAMYPILVYGVGANDPACRADATTPNILKMQIDYIKVTA